MSAQGAWFKDSRQLQGVLVLRVAGTYTGRTDGSVIDPLDESIVVRLRLRITANAPVIAGQTQVEQDFPPFQIPAGIRAGQSFAAPPVSINLVAPPNLPDGFQLSLTVEVVGGTVTYKGRTANIPAGARDTDTAVFRLTGQPPGAGITVDIEIT
jgi:hypothetical protein